jgi:hypothetical protein
MPGWSKRSIEWIQGDEVCISVPFTWYLPAAYSRCVALKQEGFDVYAGGPAVKLIPDYLSGVVKTQYNTMVDVVSLHNPDATFTSRGCIRRCEFCAVPKIEGDLRELKSWTPRPIVCDNNLLACSRLHFDKVIDSLKSLKGVDFNQGLDARLLSAYHVARLHEINLAAIRFSWDFTPNEPEIMDAINLVLAAGFARSKIHIYVMFGFRDTPADALYRLQTLKDMGITVNPQRYQPLDALKKNAYVAQGWTENELRRYVAYWSRQNWYSSIPFKDFRVENRGQKKVDSYPLLMPASPAKEKDGH